MYLVKITAIEKESFTDREYQRIADAGNPKDNGVVYGYVEHPNTKEVTKVVYEQLLENDEIDIPTIIKAVNQIM